MNFLPGVQPPTIATPLAWCFAFVEGTRFHTSFGHLVDLNRVGELAGIARSNGHVRIGALTRQAVAEHDATVAADTPLLARALPHIGHFQIRNRGTVGGSIYIEYWVPASAKDGESLCVQWRYVKATNS